MNTVQAVNSYLRKVDTATKSTATKEEYSRVLRAFCEFAGEQEPSPMTVSEFAYFLQARRKVSQNTVRQYLIVLNGFFSWGVEHGIYEKSPVVKSDIPKRERIEYDLLTAEEIETLLNAPTPYGYREETRTLVHFLLLTAVRVSEAISLRVNALDFENGTIEIIGKGDKLRYAPFSVKVREEVSRMLKMREKANLKAKRATELNDYLFTHIVNGEQVPYTRQGVSQTVERYVARVTGHSGIRAHDLRHAGASYMDSRGATMREVQQVLGHSSISTTERVYVEVLHKNIAAKTVSELL